MISLALPIFLIFYRGSQIVVKYNFRESDHH